MSQATEGTGQKRETEENKTANRADSLNDDAHQRPPTAPPASSNKDKDQDSASPASARQNGLASSKSQPAATSKQTVLEIHGYRVGRTMGNGSYATVKEAYSQKHRCKVAVKIISKRKAPQDYLDKFLPREIEVVKLLKHPNLVVFLQSIETNNRVYLVMEHVPNGDLLDMVRTRKFVKEAQAGQWLNQMVDGVDYCHRKGVVHRDLKCENILLDDVHNIKVTDFGFAKSGMNPKPSGEPVLSETYCGSYAYAPPEILTGTPYEAQGADVWSLGVILFVMVFGRLPFDDSNHKKLLRQVHRGPCFPEQREVSIECKDLIQRLLVKRETRIRIPELRKHIWSVRYPSNMDIRSSTISAASRASTVMKQAQRSQADGKDATQQHKVAAAP